MFEQLFSLSLFIWRRKIITDSSSFHPHVPCWCMHGLRVEVVWGCLKVACLVTVSCPPAAPRLVTRCLRNRHMRGILIMDRPAASPWLSFFCRRIGYWVKMQFRLVCVGVWMCVWVCGWGSVELILELNTKRLLLRLHDVLFITWVLSATLF